MLLRRFLAFGTLHRVVFEQERSKAYLLLVPASLILSCAFVRGTGR